MTMRFWSSSNCSHRRVSGIGMSLKFRFSCGMALLACPRSYWQVSGAAQESIGKAAKTQEVIQGADEWRILRCAGRILEVGPVGGDQRLASVRQNENELQAVRHACLPEDLQRLSFERMMRTRDGHAFGEVLMMGSVSWFPSTTSTTIGCPVRRHRVADQRILRLIQKWLKAGVSEDGIWSETKVGTPQGAVVSPLLANIYLHYVFDLWVEAWRKKCASGDVIVVRYVDDTVMGFEHREEAERFLRDLGERLRKFGLELHPDKTRLIEFGRHAERNRKQRGEKKPESFDFLGFTHLCGKTSKQGHFMVLRKTAGKRMRAKLRQIKQLLLARKHDPVQQTGEWLRSVVQGYFNYHAVPGNGRSMGKFREQVARYWRLALRRRSQKSRMTWDRFRPLAQRWIPVQRVLHPFPTRAVRRHSSKVGASCGQFARGDLCGGCRATGIPTATSAGTQPERRLRGQDQAGVR